MGFGAGKDSAWVSLYTLHPQRHRKTSIEKPSPNRINDTPPIFFKTDSVRFEWQDTKKLHSPIAKNPQYKEREEGFAKFAMIKTCRLYDIKNVQNPHLRRIKLQKYRRNRYPGGLVTPLP
jgi:hypothetical protein